VLPKFLKPANGLRCEELDDDENEVDVTAAEAAELWLLFNWMGLVVVALDRLLLLPVCLFVNTCAVLSWSTLFFAAAWILVIKDLAWSTTTLLFTLVILFGNFLWNGLNSSLLVLLVVVVADFNTSTGYSFFTACDCWFKGAGCAERNGEVSGEVDGGVSVVSLGMIGFSFNVSCLNLIPISFGMFGCSLDVFRLAGNSLASWTLSRWLWTWLCFVNLK
jgi:hypothetical protein